MFPSLRHEFSWTRVCDVFPRVTMHPPSIRGGAQRRTRNPEAAAESSSRFQARAHSASKTRVHALMGAPWNDGERLRNQQNLAEVLVGPHVLMAGLGLRQRIGLVDRHLDAAGLDVVPEVGAHLDEDLAHLLDRAGAEGDADVVDALASVGVEVEL